MKCLSLHSADIPQDHRWHWTYTSAEKKKYWAKKVYPSFSQGQKYGPKYK